MNLRIIISPAKKMNEDTDSLPWQDLPSMLPKTRILLEKLRSMSPADLQRLWKCNDSIARLNIDRLNDMDPESRLTPAILAYEGIQYLHMAPGVFSDAEFVYVQKHLRILSGFYGVLKPLDGVDPYRLEMQTKLPAGGHRDLYSFWGASIMQQALEGADCVLNLASREYSICISRHLPPSIPMIDVIFGEEKNGKIVEKGTMCKMARGEMVRFMAENQIVDLQEIKNFNRLDFHFSKDHSSDKTFIFLKNQKREPR